MTASQYPIMLAATGERDEMRALLLDHPSATLPSMVEYSSANTDDIRDVEAIVDRLLAAGYHKHPEREITDATVERAATVLWTDYEQQYDGSEIDGFFDQARRVLEAALRVPVGEGEQ